MELGDSNNINESEDAVRGGEPSMGSYLGVEDTCNLRISDSVSGCSQQGQHCRKQRRRKGLCAALEYDSVPSSPSVLDSPTFCVECGAKKFQYETPGFCCSGGSVKLATNDYPQELVKLFDVGDEDTLHFRTYVRFYNNLFAFSSLGGKIECSKKKGAFVFSLHGQLYHYIPPLSPEDQRPQYLQLYFYDALHERENRTNLFDVLRPDVVSIIMRVMEKNPYANFFKSLPDEVAVIWPEGSSSFENCGPYIVVTGGNNETHRIMHHYGCYDPLQYPLLFPYGDSGWHQGIKKNLLEIHYLSLSVLLFVQRLMQQVCFSMKNYVISETSNNNRAKYVSCREYYSFKLQIRDGNHLLRAARLLLQLIVDMYVKLENTQLDFLRNNQATIRADLYQGILDTLESGEANGANVGRRVVLPPSFIGGPRDMRKRYLNAMRLVQKYGKPDLFITMTCNPNWKEIKDELRPGEQAQDRPDLIARIFRTKLIRAKKLFMEERVMGNVAAMIYVVEFQKQGLPHAHFLLILAKEHKIKSAVVYDKYVSAEIPPLRKVVVHHMMHGPCGITHLSCPCMEEKNGRKVCRSGFPKKFAAHTTSHDDGYPIYRRRQTGETICVRGEDLDN